MGSRAQQAVQTQGAAHSRGCGRHLELETRRLRAPTPGGEEAWPRHRQQPVDSGVGRHPRCTQLLSPPVSAVVVVVGIAAPAQALWGGGCACSLQTRKSHESPGRGQHAALVTGAPMRPSLGGTATPATGPMVLHQDQMPTVDGKLMFPGGVGPAGRGSRRGAGSGLDAPCLCPSSGSCSQELRVGRHVALTSPGHAHTPPGTLTDPAAPEVHATPPCPAPVRLQPRQSVISLLVTRPEPSAQLRALGAPARLSCPPARPTWPLPRCCPPRLPHASQGNVTRLEVVRSKSVSTWRFS
uniref:uncharacterized protein LOC129523407 n=1 Tax=Nyctereutes procyonoides TaxID=34880 RepID=UPI0024442CA2|nr:uncharacterized protein LOC129523407 [Nyctereutes procyonoides]